tara:strand:- start:141 stop:362 length:222 start_codon:yes stop_codon:yes gene_type:complete
MNNLYAAAVVTMFGLVDVIEGKWLTAEVTFPSGQVEEMEFPVQLFPCDIQEGEMFYSYQIDGVTEIRCGEPPV